MQLHGNPHLISKFLAGLTLSCMVGAPASHATASKSASTSNDTYIVFDVPGSTCMANFGFCTTPVAINDLGTVTGYYADSVGSLHGFVRYYNGTFSTFDGPGAVCATANSLCTQPSSINAQGAITGYYCDAMTCHGFLRSRAGTITTFDPPGSQFTTTSAINDEGTITGAWYDANFVPHGFLRTRNGMFTSFDPLGSTATSPLSIDDAGTITGGFPDTQSVNHGFLRTCDGSITVFDPPGSLETEVSAISGSGIITGQYIAGSSVAAIHGFLRLKSGGFLSFDGPGTQTSPSAINRWGTVVGSYVNGTFHGFYRSLDGAVGSFDPPNSIDTFPGGINTLGMITGWFIDPQYLGHGFVRVAGKHWYGQSSANAAER